MLVPIVLLAVVLAAASEASPVAPPSLPSLPKQYYVAFDFRLPQWAQSGYASVNEPTEVWFDGVGKREKISFFGGLDQNVMRETEIGLIEGYMVYPQDDKLVCDRSYVDTLFGLASAFPSDLDQFKFAGYVDNWKGHRRAEKWFRFQPQGATNNFTFYVDAATRDPISYTYAGDSGSLMGYQHSPNYDWFDVVYTSWKPGFLNTSAFDLPAVCSAATMRKGAVRGGAPLGLEALFSSLGGHEGDRSPDAVNTRRMAFRQNAAFVAQHNADSKRSYSVRLNPRFAFSLPFQLTASSKGYDAREFVRERASAPKERFYQPLSKRKEDLPAEINWVTKGAVTKLKDQGDCGSCWSFGSVAAVEGAQFVKHKQLVPLSEQFLMDCSWSEGNNACFGGDHASSYDYVIKHNGGRWPSESDYGAYRMNEGFCNKKTNTSAVKLTTFSYVIGEHALMDALANHGPVAVSMSTFPAAPFAFYHKGVYENALCNPLIPDHIVTAVGYGTESGKDYWLLKNQWSSFWGEQGKKKTQPFLCGLSPLPC
jgi:C1A family cysteine protease